LPTTDHDISTLQTLLSKAVKGDTDAISRLLSSVGPKIEQELAIGRRWRHALDAGDVMQVTYLEAFLQISRFRPEQAGSFEAWLRRIAENNLRDAIRGMERQKQPPPSRRVAFASSTDESFTGLYDQLAAKGTTPSRAFARKDIQRLIEAALSKLPADYALVVRSYDLDGRSMEEVATAMGRSKGAIHMLRARAHDLLGELLETASSWFESSA
jgi:RNA polymerase sigma factor (sigma-70 family)